MRIRKLDLFGFKSFPDRTTFEFGQGISCVVGPNGSGKSNVVDALRWCIGEQSARSLRGADMSDVIFAGSAARSPVGFAEVTLTLASEGGEPFPGDFSRFEELEVGRRLYRDGTSEYLVNRVKCRRRDIVDLFLDTGVGSNLYSFIAQGQVDRIVSQSAHERRSLIDEAAGITRYKARREEAMARLTATAAQLDRAADVSDEMGRRIRSLEKQVLKAGRFRRARAKIRQREIALGVVKYGALAEDRRALRETLRKAKDDAGALSRSAERLGAELETRDAEVQSVREALQRWREEAAEQEAQRREAEGARRLQQDRHRELLDAAARATTRVDRARSEVEAAQQERDRAARELEDLENAGGNEVGAARDAREAAAVEVGRRRGDAQRARDVEARRVERVRGLTEEAGRLEVQLAGLRVQPLSAATVESAELEDGGALEAAVEAARERASAARRVLESHRHALTTAEEVQTSLRREAEQALAAWERARSDREARLAALRRWFSSEARAARNHRESVRSREVAEARRRGSVWLSALRERHAAEAASGESAHREALEALRAAQERALESLREKERSEIAAVEDRLDTSPVEGARARLDAARSAADHAASERRTASEAASTAAGALRAQESEFAELEARRAAVVPGSWADRALLADLATGEDARRTARPELLGLPVIGVDDLAESSGRGVLGGVASPWRVVDTLEEAIAVLASHGPPVVSRDGRLRVDVDGLVELGERPADRWAIVRDGLPAARERASNLEIAAELARGADEQARSELDAAAEALREAQSGVVAARESALQAVRAGIAREVQEVSRAHAEREAALFTERDAAARTQAARVRAELEAAELARDHAIAALPEPADPTRFLRGALGLALPGPLGPRPDRHEGGDLSAPRTAVREAESEVERADHAVREASTALDRHRDAVRALEREVAEREAARQARLAEAGRIETRLLEVQALLEGSAEDPALERSEAALLLAEAALAEADEAWRAMEAAAAARRERRAAAQERLERSVEAIGLGEAGVSEARAEIARSEAAAAAALSESEQAEQTAGMLAVQRAETLSRVERDRDRLEKLTAEQTRVRESLDDARERAVRAEAERAEMEQRVQNLMLEIEALRKRLGDRYQVSLPGLLDRLWMRKRLVLDPDEGVQERLVVREVELEAVEPLSIGIAFADDADAVRQMVSEVEELRAELQAFGEVNLAAEEEYRELDERHRELLAQAEDLDASVKTIRAAIAKMNRTCRERFRDAYDRVNEAFQLSYPKLVGGGDARLALTDEEDLLETGVDIFVRPPGKRLQNLTLLSGGEKAMTAIALLLALFQVKPSPFCVLDEVDAPLDEANGARFNDMVREMSRMSQFIVITHNRKTMECADVLYGVTMAHPGVSTLVSVALDA
ncbi:MAG: AAA family ATPase [Myxococcota bacterium]